MPPKISPQKCIEGYRKRQGGCRERDGNRRTCDNAVQEDFRVSEEPDDGSPNRRWAGLIGMGELHENASPSGRNKKCDPSPTPQYTDEISRLQDPRREPHSHRKGTDEYRSRSGIQTAYSAIS